jgi:hypothetical protein
LRVPKPQIRWKDPRIALQACRSSVEGERENRSETRTKSGMELG